MKIHEFQAKEILRRFGVPVPEGAVAYSAGDAAKIAEGLGGRVVVKAQIHAGGRGKGGGVRLADSAPEAGKIAGQMLGMTLVTHQTGPKGRVVKKVLVEKACDVERELYLGITLDRASSHLAVIASPDGGVEIEKVASENPEKIFRAQIDPCAGFRAREAKGLGRKLGLAGVQNGEFAAFATKLYKAYFGCDAALLEINPLVLTKGGKLLALDAKINLDDNALYRHDDLAVYLDPDEEDPLELEAKRHGLSYISLAGSIGCMVNGAGLAMATMDIIKLKGGEPANFLDVGGGTTKENVGEAFKIILRDSKVRSILINIFGGIVKCDLIAAGVAAAAKEFGVKVPLVVRLQGTNVEKGRGILKKSGLDIISVETLDEAAEEAVRRSR